VRSDLPSGTVTFVFTDIEGSTNLLSALGAERYAEALAEHRRILREAFREHGGAEVDTQGDAFFYAFPTAPGALEAAAEASQHLAQTPVSVRVGIHTGAPLLMEEGYVGHDVHKAARIAAAGHGRQILVSASAAVLVDRHDLRDLGEHRLKDLSAPERIFQLGDEGFPPLKTLYQTNLPVPATPFLGRERELWEVVNLLERKDNRLLTLTGAGGSGKTRLALQSAAALAEGYPHGVFWIPLAPLRDPALVLETASSALGADDGLADHIADKRLLLLLDNFEHLLDAAADVSSVLSSCPNLNVLVTSREPLHVSGEQEYSVPPLAHEEAVGFFATRARAVDPAFEVDEAVADICERLDDLPLALELAAARVKALTPNQILQRLEQRLPLLTGGTRDAPERQRTLKATIEWSYELLSEEEQRLFARLAVFRGGCTLEAAEEVAGADLDTLQSLIDKSLLRRRDERYWMLETIREFAAEALEASGETEELGRRHADSFLALAEDAEPHLRGQPQAWLNRLGKEHDNLRAAFDCWQRSGETEHVQRLVAALWRFWVMRGHAPEGGRRAEAAVAADQRPTTARGGALTGAAVLALEQGDTVRARQRAEASLTLYLALGDAWGIANSKLLLGNVCMEEGRNDEARALFEDCRARFSALGDDHYTLLSMRVLAWAHFELGEKDQAAALHEEVVRRARAVGNDRMTATSLAALAEYALYEERVGEAVERLLEAVAINREVGDVQEPSANLARLARALVLVGQPVDAARALAASYALDEKLGRRIGGWMTEMNARTEELAREHLDEQEFRGAWEEGSRLDPDEAFEAALAKLRPRGVSAEGDEAGLVEP
jgi:predicted ATPase